MKLVKKGNETSCSFELKIEQLVEKGWCNKNASTIKPKCNEIFTRGLMKNLLLIKDKHTSTVLEPSIAIHTLVELVDAEDIANDKYRTHDLTSEVNILTNKLQSQTIEQQPEQRMFTQSKDPNNKSKLAYKKYCSYCHRTNHSISSCFKKCRDDDDKREAYARSKSPQKCFVQCFCSNSNRTNRKDERTNENYNQHRSRSTPRNSYHNKNICSQNIYFSTSRDRNHYDRSTTPQHYTRSRYDKYKRDSRLYCSPYRSYRSPDRHDFCRRNKSRSYSRDNNFTRYTSSFRPPSKPRDSRYSKSRSHFTTRNKFNTVQTQSRNDHFKFLVHMYHPKEMANALTPKSWFYSLPSHTPERHNKSDYHLL